MEATVTSDQLALISGERALEMLGGISAKHAYNLRRKGLLPFVRVGHRIMYRPESLREFARQNEQQATGAKE